MKNTSIRPVRGLAGLALAAGATAGLLAPLAPLAERLGLEVGDAPEFGEPEFGGDPHAAAETALRVLEDADVTVVCSQGGTMPASS